jgi:hypothetical protein
MWQLVLNDGGKGQDRSTAFKTPDGRGDINFGELMNNPQLTAEVESFLQSRGASFSEASSKVFAPTIPRLMHGETSPWRPAKYSLRAIPMHWHSSRGASAEDIDDAIRKGDSYRATDLPFGFISCNYRYAFSICGGSFGE